MRKKFVLTLTQENVELAHQLLKEIGLGKHALSAIIDDQLASFLPVLIKMAEAKRAGKQLSFEEFASQAFEMMGKALKS